MPIHGFVKAAAFAAAIVFVPAFAEPAVTRQPGPAGFSFRSARRATDELNVMHEDARRIAYRATALRQSADAPAQLHRIRAEVDDLNRRLLWLENSRTLIAPGQRQAAVHSAPLNRSLRKNAAWLGAHAGDLQSPSFGVHARRLRMEARQIELGIDNGERLARAEIRDQHLRNNVGMLAVDGR